MTDTNPGLPPAPRSAFKRWGGWRRLVFAFGLACAVMGMSWWHGRGVGFLGGLLVGLTLPFPSERHEL
jgi:hypothetical protein